MKFEDAEAQVYAIMLLLMLMYKLQLHKCLAAQVMKPDMINEKNSFKLTTESRQRLGSGDVPWFTVLL